jgi:hypothetical protein
VSYNAANLHCQHVRLYKHDFVSKFSAVKIKSRCSLGYIYAFCSDLLFEDEGHVRDLRVCMVKRKDVRVKVLTAASVMTALWYMVPCSLIEVHRRFRGAYYTTLHPRRLSSSKGKMSLKTKRFQVDVKPLLCLCSKSHVINSC